MTIQLHFIFKVSTNTHVCCVSVISYHITPYLTAANTVTFYLTFNIKIKSFIFVNSDKQSVLKKITQKDKKNI